MKSRGRSPVSASSAPGSAAAAAAQSSSSPLAASAASPATLAASYQPAPLRGMGSKHLMASASGSGGGGRVPSDSGSDYGIVIDPSASSPAHRANNASLALSSVDGLGRDLTPAAADSSADASGLGNSIFYDDPDLDGTDPALTQKAIDQLTTKIERTKDLIKVEQTTRDDNVNEYLKLSSNADRQQAARIKQVFEKKNTKSAQNIAHYGKKLEEYQRRMLDLQEHGLRPKQSHKLGKGLKNVGGNIRDGITGMSSSVMSKQKEFAHLIRHKFGSADNLASMGGGEGEGGKNPNHHGSASLPRENSGLAGAHDATGSGGGRDSDRHSSFASQGNKKRKCISEDGGGLGIGGRSRSDRSESMATSSEAEQRVNVAGGGGGGTADGEDEKQESGGALSPDDDELQQLGGGARRGHLSSSSATAEWKAVMQELVLHREEVEHLREEMEEQRQQFKSEIESLTYQLREERDRCERLEEQVNDLTELHQHEIENIKSGVGDMEEKVQYQSEERLLDIKETLQALETKVTSVEHQQTQQQYLNIEGLDNTDARAIMMKLLTAVITVVHVVLFVVGVLMGVARPFLRTTPRAMATLAVVSAAIYARTQQEAIMAIYRRFRPLPDDENSEL